MRRLLERSISSLADRLVLLAPPHAPIPDSLSCLAIDPARHEALLREMQRLRGSVYLQDGAVKAHQLSPDGRHRTPEDDRGWHLLLLNDQWRIRGCSWYLEHDGARSIHDLRAQSCPLADQDEIRQAVNAEIARARKEYVRYSEVGGWAVEKQGRCTGEGLVLILVTFALSRTLGGALGLTTATVRHSSSTILRRFGFSSFEVSGVPVMPYHDPKYGCDMELLRFDTRQSDPKYHGLIEQVRSRLAEVTVIARTASQAATAAA
jgi:hypothetical protein